MNKINIPQAALINSRVGDKSASDGRVATAEVTPVKRVDDVAADRSSIGVTAASASATASGVVFDRARVDQIRSQIASGQYAVNVHAVAEGLLAQSRELQGLA